MKINNFAEVANNLNNNKFGVKFEVVKRDGVELIYGYLDGSYICEIKNIWVNCVMDCRAEGKLIPNSDYRVITGSCRLNDFFEWLGFEDCRHINKSIIGYEFVKNVGKCYGVEHGRQDYLFVLRRGDGDYLSRLVEVRENTEENYQAIRAKYPYENDDYILWWGDISYSLCGKTDEIIFHWG